MESWQGLGASAGWAEGHAHLLRTGADFGGVEPGAILVARHATPGLLPALLTARGVICETGGYLCHLAVLARELGKPCVTGLPGVLARVRPGERLRIDGGTGRVERPDGSLPPGETGAASPGPPELTPALRFGEFSAAFEPRPAPFTLELALRTAALVGLPRAFGGGPDLGFEVTGAQVLVETRALRALTERLADRFEAGSLDAGSLRGRYEADLGWAGWDALAAPTPGPGLLLAALRRAYTLNALTWLAALVRETLARRYHDFLVARWPVGAPADLQTAFLDGLSAPGRSYILRHALGETSGCVWSAGPAAGLPGAWADLARPLREAARGRQERALAELERRLDAPGAARARRFVETLSDLVDLTERKNTDLDRCGRTLFRADLLPVLGALCGLSPDAASPETPGARRTRVERCLETARGVPVLAR